MSSRVPVMLGVLSTALAMLAPAAVAQQGGTDIPRTADGRPDLSGTYDIATLTPLQRPVDLGDKLVLTEEEAAALAAGAGALVHTVIRKDLVDAMPMQRIRDICDYHSTVEQAADTAARAGVGILILTHYVPPIAPGQEDDWRALAATAFDRQIEIGEALHRVEVPPGVCARQG